MKPHLALACLLASTTALADAPLPLPQQHTVCSRDARVCATSDPATRLTRVSVQAAGQDAWTIPGWHRWILVSDDGRSVITGYSGLNLVPVDVTPEQAVLTFHDRDTQVRSVTLGELYPGLSGLTRTVSHYAWTNGIAINRANQVVVTLVDGSTVAFDASTGQRQRVLPDAP